MQQLKLWIPRTMFRRFRNGGVRLNKKATVCSHQKEPMLWLLDDNATVGSVQSDSVGPGQSEEESTAGQMFHSALKRFDMVLPATFLHDKKQEVEHGPRALVPQRG